MTPDSPDLSVVIPVFNGGRTIHRTLDSLLAAVRNVRWELLVMDDGSTDNTAKLVSRYVKRHPFIRLEKRKQNRGAGFTRNQSMALARGRYLWFVDADDEIPSRAFDDIDAALLNQDIDVLIFDYDLRLNNKISPMFNLDEALFARFLKTDFTIADAPEILTSSHTPCNKFFRAQFLLENDIRFLEDVSHEDVPFHIKALCLASRMRKRRGSLFLYCLDNSVNSRQKDWRLAALRAFAECETFLRSFQGMNAGLMTAWRVFKANHLFWVYHNASEALQPEIRRYNDDFLASLPAVELPGFIHHPFLRRDVMRHALRLRGISPQLLKHASPLMKLLDFFRARSLNLKQRSFS
ncbi:MAG: glycosyltransferase [Candidatus Accumulibacter sp.]|nr:glycosyltransferase [Accumulibacter sp.]